MFSKDFEKTFLKLNEIVRKESGDWCVAVKIIIDSQGATTEIVEKNPDQLKRAGISMKNICGEWILPMENDQ